MVLGRLCGVTFVTPDLEASIAAYGEYLGYRGKDLGQVTADDARKWHAPGIEGRRMTVLTPQGGEPSFIRLVEDEGAGDLAPLSSFGWAAAEIIVRDLDALAARLDQGPFRVIGPPERLDLDFTDKIRAMQVVGPGQEVLYLTEVSGEVPGFDLPEPVGEVGQIFVAVLAGASQPALAAEMTEDIGMEPGPVFEAGIPILSRAHDLPENTRYALSAVMLPGKTLMELDAYPESAGERPKSRGGLPLGMAMASFASPDAPSVEPAGADSRVIRTSRGTLFELLQ